MGRHIRGLWLKIWIASRALLDPALGGEGQPSGCGNMRADQQSREPALRVRFAPSPTGALHIGGARTALYNWLHARGTGGALVLRIEDTDRERSTPENVEQILDALRWLELDWDEGPLSQAERRRSPPGADRASWSSRARRIRTPRPPRTSRRGSARTTTPATAASRGTGDGAAIRLRVPDEGETVVDDLIRGQVRFENRLTDDLVIARGDGTPLYNFAVAVDDAEMGITDVVRGDDHLSNTPKQLLVLEALGFEPPRYAHLPLLHGPDGKKLSKRHGAASVQELRDGGLPAGGASQLPGAARLGGRRRPDDPLDRGAGRAVLDSSGSGRSSAIFDETKLRWMNGRFMRELPLDEYVECRGRTRWSAIGPRPRRAADRERLAAACEIVREKAQTLDGGLAADRLPVRADPVDDPKAWEKVMGRRGRRALLRRRPRGRCAAAGAVRPPTPRGARSAPWSSGRA